MKAVMIGDYFIPPDLMLQACDPFREAGIEITRRGDTVVIKGEDTTMGRPVEVAMDVVVLSVGMEPSEGSTRMAEIFGLPLESHGFIETIGAAVIPELAAILSYVLLAAILILRPQGLIPAKG